jgi:hypothetical protein
MVIESSWAGAHEAEPIDGRRRTPILNYRSSDRPRSNGRRESRVYTVLVDCEDEESRLMVA